MVTQPQPNAHAPYEGIIFNQRRRGMFPIVGSKQKKGPVKPPKEPKDKTPEEKIHELAVKSSQVLFTTEAVFPFDLFPDILTVTANKIDIVQSNFFASRQTSSIPLRDIASVEVQTSPFFATLSIINMRYPMEPHVINYLKKNEAIKAKTIIDGLLVALSQGADIAEIEPNTLLKEIEKVGASAVAE